MRGTPERPVAWWISRRRFTLHRRRPLELQFSFFGQPLILFIFGFFKFAQFVFAEFFRKFRPFVFFPFVRFTQFREPEQFVFQPFVGYDGPFVLEPVFGGDGPFFILKQQCDRRVRQFVLEPFFRRVRTLDGRALVGSFRALFGSDGPLVFRRSDRRDGFDRPPLLQFGGQPQARREPQRAWREFPRPGRFRA